MFDHRIRSQEFELKSFGEFGQWWDRKELFLKRPPTPVEGDGNAEDGGKEHGDGHAQPAGKKGKGKGAVRHLKNYFDMQ